MKILMGITAAITLLCGAVPLRAQAPSQPPLGGVHPEEHGPLLAPAPAPDDNTVIVTGKHRRTGLFRRVGHFFHRIFHGKRRWYTTPSHRNHCKQRFRSYDAKSNSYRAYSGARRKCVL